MNTGNAKPIAFGGIMVALALIIMCLGGLIPVATYICPMLCMLIMEIVRSVCGQRIAWPWYGAVSVLSLLMGPDKEAAALFLCLGFYPILKPRIDRLRFPLLWKLMIFNGSVLICYFVLIRILGLNQILSEFQQMEKLLLILTLILGNLTFFLMDRLLSRFGRHHC